MPDPRLVKSQVVEVTLHHDRRLLLPHGLPGQVDAEEDLALAVNGRFRRIDILRERLVQDSPAKADRPSLCIGNGEQEPVAEGIVVPAPLPFPDQPTDLRSLQRSLFPLQVSGQGVPAVWGKSEPIRLSGWLVDPAQVKIASAALPCPLFLEHIAVELGRNLYNRCPFANLADFFVRNI